jgi:hypothetical protein
MIENRDNANAKLAVDALFIVANSEIRETSVRALDAHRSCLGVNSINHATCGDRICAFHFGAV